MLFRGADPKSAKYCNAKATRLGYCGQADINRLAEKSPAHLAGLDILRIAAALPPWGALFIRIQIRTLLIRFVLISLFFRTARTFFRLVFLGSHIGPPQSKLNKIFNCMNGPNMAFRTCRCIVGANSKRQYKNPAQHRLHRAITASTTGLPNKNM